MAVAVKRGEKVIRRTNLSVLQIGNGAFERDRIPVDRETSTETENAGKLAATTSEIFTPAGQRERNLIKSIYERRKFN